MKKGLRVLFLTLIIFICFSLLTMKNEMINDGNTTIGFPFTFFTKYGGKCISCSNSPIEINYIKLFGDILVSLLVAILIWVGYNFIQKRRK